MMGGGATEEFSKANHAFVDEDFQLAYDCYSRAILASPNDADYYLKRAITAAKLLNWQHSLDDSISAISLSTLSNLVFLKSHIRKGVALYELGKYQEARDALYMSESTFPHDALLKSYIEKCHQKGAHLKISPLILQENAEPIFNPIKVRHEWYQNENFITISVFIKKIAPDSVTVDFTERTLSLCAKLPSGTDFTLELGPLSHTIDPKGMTSYIDKLERKQIQLKKTVFGVKWGSLEGNDPDLVQNMSNTAQNDKPVYPTSSKKKNDWNAMEKAVSDEKPEGEQALNSLFQQIYRDATPETQRAMIKSFTESNGTCLSTNWEDIGNKRVEITPPDGMIAKKFEY